MDFVERYLTRLEVQPAARNDLEFLRELHSAHLRHIPFENLSNHLNEPLSLDPNALSDKILTRGRGGFCYELNGLFSVLLRELGYEVTLLGARVSEDGGLGPPLDHLVLRVGLGQPDGSSEDSGPADRWIVDVGFGEHSVYPLPWQTGIDHDDPGGVFRLEAVADGNWDLYRNGSIQYRIEPNLRMLPDFEAMCWYHQHAPESHFTKSLVCSLQTGEGRVTLSGRRLISTTASGRQEFTIDDDHQLLAIYRSRFGIDLSRLPDMPE